MPLFLIIFSCPRSEEANKAFSAAVQMHDVLVKAWAMWGDYLENIFVKDRQLHLGVSAITCYLHACRHQNESKSRKYLAKVRTGVGERVFIGLYVVELFSNISIKLLSLICNALLRVLNEACQQSPKPSHNLVSVLRIVSL